MSGKYRSALLAKIPALAYPGNFYALLFVCLSVISPMCALAQTPVSGDQGDSTWVLSKSPYLITGNITIPAGRTLTIEPGVEVRFNASNACQLTVQGTLKAVGTAASNIKFTGINNCCGGVRGPIVIDATSTNTQLQYVTIDNLTTVYVRSSSTTVDHCTIQNSGGNAIVVENNALVPITNNVITNSSPLDVILGVDNLSRLTGNNFLKVGLSAQTMTKDTVLSTANVYYLTNHLTIPAGRTLTIEPGVEVRFNASNACQLTVQGTLKAVGTAASNIKFTGINNCCGGVRGPIVIDATSTNTQLQYVTIDNLTTVYVRSSSTTVDHCTIQNSGGNAIVVENNALVPITNNVITNSSPLDVILGVDNLSRLTGNNFLKVGLSAQTMTKDTVLSTANVYYLTNHLTIPAGRTLTIEPGVEVRFNASNACQLTVQGTLKAVGTAASNIKFTGINNCCGGVRGPIVIDATSTNTQLQYVTIDNLTTVYVRSSSTTVDHCTIQNSGGNAIVVENNTSPKIKNNIFLSNGGNDINANALTLTNIFSNINAAVYINATTVNQNAVLPNPGINSRYVLNGTITVNANYNLNIAPGTKVDFNNNSGNIVVNGSITAVGTEANRIQLIKQAVGGSSGGTLSFGASSSGSSLVYVNTDRLGSVTSPAKGAAIELNTSSINIVNLSISNSENNGLSLNNTSPTITQSNFLNNKVGVLSAGGKATFRDCGFVGNTSFGINNTSANAADIVDAANCWWGKATGPRHPSNPGGQGDSVSNKVIFVPYKTETLSSLVPDIGVSAVLSPLSSCNLTAAETVKISISNYSNVNVNAFRVSYKINNNAPVTDSVSSLTIPAGGSADYSFPTKANLSAVGGFTIKAFTTLGIDPSKANDTTAVNISHLVPLTKPANLLPANNSTGLNPPVTFYWSVVPNALVYDFYLWKSTDAVPGTPLAANLTQISFTYSGSLLQYASAYKWKVVARNNDCTTAGTSDVLSFSLRGLPDLIVDSISTPAHPVSETPMKITWRTKNQGTGNTDNSWTETVYLSPTVVFDDRFSTVLGTVNSLTPLNTGAFYRSIDFIYTIPVGQFGRRYVVIKTNSGHSLQESNYDNNVTVSDSVDIVLAPWPDLKVTGLTQNPQYNVYADSTMKITYTVTNNGSGPTAATSWADKIYFSSLPVFNADSAVLLATVPHNGKLNGAGSYSQSNIPVHIPPHIYGTFYIHVLTDANNQVFENIGESNNATASNPITLFLNPAPNLTIGLVTVQTDTVTNRQPLTVQWTEKNKGAIAALPNWVTKVYLSLDTFFKSSEDIPIGSVTGSQALNSLDSITRTLNATIPATLGENKYYVIVVADANDNLYESADNLLKEDDNTGRTVGQITITNPDLKPVLVTAPDTASSEEVITVSWQVNNVSTANLFNASWTDRIYISADNKLDVADTLLASVPVNMFVSANGSYLRQQNVTIPRGMSGKRYLFVTTDYNNNVVEKSELNDTLSRPITVRLSPFADLQVPSVQTAKTDTTGTALNITYTVKNGGKKAIDAQEWDDYLYLSPTKSLSETNLTYIGSVHQSRSLDTSASYTQQATFNLSPSLIAGRYYLMVYADGGNAVYENAFENNNKNVGDTLNIVPFPYVDLAALSATTPQQSISAGQNIAVTRVVKNVGNTPTLVTSWQDAVYLSNNTVLDASDRLLGEWTVQKTLNANDSYIATTTVTIPQDVTGAFYLLVTTDKNNGVNDITRSNNTKVIAVNAGNGISDTTIIITQPPPADLVVDSLSVPFTALAGQPVTVRYTVSNRGAGITQAKYWTDKIYLSSDFNLSGDDLLLAMLPHTDSLQAGGFYTNTAQAFLPHSISGNYIVIVKTDANNNVYEKSAEENNTRYAGLFVGPQDPCDLVVDSVKVPAVTTLAGNNVTIEWKIKNTGSNAANGYTRDAVYISADTVWDSRDVLLGFTDGTISLAPLQAVKRTLTAPLLNLMPGTYYVIVRTDLLNNLDELSNDNNTTVSVSPLAVDVKPLPFALTTMDSLDRVLPLYYKVVVPDSLVGETLQVTLNGDSLHGAVNRVFIGYNRLPDQNNFDFAGQVPFTPNQQVLIPAMGAGVYYITVLGVVNNSTQRQQVSLTAKTIPFGILTVDANKGGNTGSVTVRLTGAKFEQGMTVQLTGNTNITAEKIAYTNPTQLFATFNLSGMPLGSYTVKITNAANKSAYLPNSFEIEKGSLGGTGLNGNGFLCRIENIGYENNLEFSEQHPDVARLESVAVITIFFKNTGNVNIPVPRNAIVSEKGTPISLINDFTNLLTQLLLEYIEDGAPPESLRPGASGYKKVYAKILGSPHELLPYTITQ